MNLKSYIQILKYKLKRFHIIIIESITDPNKKGRKPKGFPP